MKIFQYYPTIEYALDDNNLDFKKVRNIFTKIKFLKEVLDNADMFYRYEMRDLDTPEIIADKIYGDSNRYWLILLANEAIDPYFGVPLKYQSFDNYLITSFGSIEDAQSSLHHYEKQVTVTTNKDGLITSQEYKTELSEKMYDFSSNTIINLTMPTLENPIVEYSNSTVVIADTDGANVTITTQTNFAYISNYDYAVQENENKRIIKLIKPEYVNIIEAEFENLLK
jgi:hypothetical protein